MKHINFAIALLVAGQICRMCQIDPAASAAAQTQYEWVPGSRQARQVTGSGTNSGTSTAGGTLYQPGQNPNYQQPTGAYYPWRAQTKTGGMQLRRNYYYSSGASGYAQVQTQTQSQTQGQALSPKPGSPDKTSSATGAGRSYHFAESIAVDGVQRQFQVHIPECYDRSKPAPVVFVFHGLGMNSTMMVGLSGFNGVSERNGCIVVYGDAAGGRWYDGMSGQAANDIAYVEAILGRLGKIANIDRRRIYACGISNGGYFSQVLAGAMPDRIAAVGVVASTLMERTAAGIQGRALPIVFILGSDDALIPWGDGRVKDLGKLGEVLGLSSLGSIDNSVVRMGGLLSVPETLAFWTNHNNVGGTPRSSQLADKDPKDGTRIKKEQWGSGASEVVLYTVEGGGHTWPGSINLKAISGVSGNISQDANGAELLWEFFQGHSL